MERLMVHHENNCLWLELTADFYNYLPILAPPNTAIPHTPTPTPDKTPTPTPVSIPIPVPVPTPTIP